jgi:hypothetical protein
MLPRQRKGATLCKGRRILEGKPDIMTTFGIGIHQKTVKKICELLRSPKIDSSTNQQRNRVLFIVDLEMFRDEIYTYLDLKHLPSLP